MRQLAVRRLAAAISLIVLFFCEISAISRAEAVRRCASLLLTASMPADEARLYGSTFWFDPQLGWFVHGVAMATPPQATIAIPFVSAQGNPQTFAAAYVLAPRRVVGYSHLGEAGFAAAPRNEPLPPGTIVRVPGGTLVRR